MDNSRITPDNEPISGLCSDDLHDECEWPSNPQSVLYCSCSCHQEARAVANTRTTTSTSRKPRTAARDASRPSTARKAVAPEVDETEVSAAEAQEIEAVNKYVTALLCDEEVRVIPPGAWRQSWQRLAAQGQIDAFAQIILHPDDYELYVDIDPTNEEWGEFVGDAAERAGESLGNSHGPAPSSRRTRRR